MWICGCADMRMFRHVKCGSQCKWKSAVSPCIEKLCHRCFIHFKHTTLILL